MSAAGPIIALVTDAIYPYHKGGKELRYHELARRLGRHGTVHVYTMQWWEGPSERVEDGVVYRALTPKLPLYVDGRRSVLQALRFACACLKLAFCRFDAIEADHMPYFCLFPLRLVATIRRRRLAVTWHEVWGLRTWQAYLGPIGGRVGWLIERTAMRLPDHIISASAETAERLREHVGGRVPITVAPNGVDLDAIGAATPATTSTDIVTVGRLIDHKRIDLLLDAVAQLHARGLPASLRVIGDGPDRDVLRAHAQRLGIDHAVDFRHDVHGHDELYALLKASRVFAFPSAREGFGIAVLEALACGIPVVTTSAPDNLAQHLVARSAAGTVCEPTAAALADAVQAVLGADTTAPPELAWLQEYDWSTVTTKVASAVLA